MFFFYIDVFVNVLSFQCILHYKTRYGGTGSHKVAHHFSALFRLVKTPSIAILSQRYEKTQPLTRILCFWAQKLGSELTKWHHMAPN